MNFVLIFLELLQCFNVNNYVLKLYVSTSYTFNLTLQITITDFALQDFVSENSIFNNNITELNANIADATCHTVVSPFFCDALSHLRQLLLWDYFLSLKIHSHQAEELHYARDPLDCCCLQHNRILMGCYSDSENTLLQLGQYLSELSNNRSIGGQLLSPWLLPLHGRLRQNQKRQISNQSETLNSTHHKEQLFVSRNKK